MVRVRCFAALLVLAGLGAPAFAQDKPVELKWKFEKGKTFYQELTTKTEQTMKVMGMNITQNQNQTFYFSWTPDSYDEKEKAWTIKQKIEGVKMEIQIGGNPISFDSTKETGTSNPLSDFFKALVGAEFTLTVKTEPRPEVTKVAGQKEFLDKLVKANQQMKPLLEKILSENALKQMADPAFAVVPDKAVKPNDTWERKSTLDMGPIGTYETTNKYTYTGPDGTSKTVQKVKVDTSLKYTPPAAGADSSLPFKITKANLTSKDATGTVFFDTEKGRVDHSDATMTLTGTLDIEIGNMPTTVDLTQKQTTNLKTTDTNPVAGAPKK